MTRNGSASPFPNEFVSPPICSSQTGSGSCGLRLRRYAAPRIGGIFTARAPVCCRLQLEGHTRATEYAFGQTELEEHRVRSAGELSQTHSLESGVAEIARSGRGDDALEDSLL